MSQTLYHKKNPFLAKVKEKKLLSQVDSKQTYHLVLRIDSSFSYQVGDSIGVMPMHSKDLVSKTLQAAKIAPQTLIKIAQTEELISIEEACLEHKNITKVNPKLFLEVFKKQTNQEKLDYLHHVQEDRAALKEYLAQHEVWDFLLAHPEVAFTAQELADSLMPLLPRFYSIASSPNYVQDEVHLVIASFSYESNGHQRQGVCSHYLCDIAPAYASDVRIFQQPAHDFSLPADSSVPIIMIGAGTGVAPFRAFLQERIKYQGSQAPHWLFFGERTKKHGFFYEKEWQEFSQEGNLRLETAFSRDQPYKIYVQHKMWEYGAEFYAWLQQGAYLYVCGDAHCMAKDVETMLQNIIQEFGGLSPHEARDYVKSLRHQKRYLRDVY